MSDPRDVVPTSFCRSRTDCAPRRARRTSCRKPRPLRAIAPARPLR